MADRGPAKPYNNMFAKYSSGGAVAPSGKSEPAQDSLVYPALHLYPLNDTFASKQINLGTSGPQNRIKIGRYSNAKSVPNPLNGYFDSKVLSRAHAEVWYEEGKVYIKDVKSSNGTFVNGTRLSPESQESEPYELHGDDVVDFGIDILTDDNKDILHHRVACRVFLVVTPEDALKLRSDFTSLYRGGVHGGTLGNAGICPGAEGGLRRGKPGVNFDHVIFRLQNELQKSKMVGTELSSLSNTIQNIYETLGGGVAQTQTAPYQHLVPAREGQSNDAQHHRSSQQHAARAVDEVAIASLETQLNSTHAILSSHVERVKSLESTLAAYESIKDEVAVLRQQLDSTKRDLQVPIPPARDDPGWLAFGLPQRVCAVQAEDARSDTSMDTIVGEQPAAIADTHKSTSDDGPLLERIMKIEAHLLEALAEGEQKDIAHMESTPSAVDALQKRVGQLEDSTRNTVSEDTKFTELKLILERRLEEQARAFQEEREQMRREMDTLRATGSSHDKKAFEQRQHGWLLLFACGLLFTPIYLKYLFKK
ncbi:hypothetical protein MVES1_003556 [Malassezia vespertilionis]|nr:uncharacterized protein MVES1_003556 [Malassezia vespertilionis]WFD08185.1 hypothetical protein MVES1_003556 [Malassezia vespertilionis]